MSTNDPGTDEGSDWTSRSVMASLALVVVIVLLAGWLLWPSSDNNGTGTTNGPPSTVDGTPSTVTVRPPDNTREGDCPEQPENDDIPKTGPEVDWESFNGVLIPTSEVHGPAVVEDGGVARCFSRTPVGALIASVQFVGRYGAGPNGVAEVEAMAVPSEGREVLIDALRERGDPGPQDPGTYCQVVGFQYVTYTADEAVFNTASRCSSVLQQTQTRVQWTDGDWRQVIEPDGGTSPTAARLPSLKGFTEWSGI